MKTMHHPGTEFSLYVGDLPLDCSDDKLQSLFRSKFRSVKRVQIIRNEDGSSRGFGFIRFESRDDFEAALSQEMKIGNATLRLDTAHIRNHKNNRIRYNSFNSIGNNHHGSNHHNHHFNSNHHHQHHHQQHHQHPNQSHHHHHHNQHHHQSQQQQQQQQHNNNQLHQNQVGKTTPSDSSPTVGVPQQQQQHHHHQLTNSSLTHQGAISSQAASGSVIGSLHQSTSTATAAASGVSNLLPTTIGQHHHSTNSSHNQFAPNKTQHPQQHNNNSNQLKATLETHDKQSLKPTSQSTNLDDGSQQHQQPSTSQPSLQASSLSQSQLQQPPPTPVSHTSGQLNIQQSNNITSSTTTTTTPSNAMTSVNHLSVLPSNNNNLNINQQPAITPDLRGYPAAPMMDTHLLSTPDQPSMMPPNNVYGHLYPYGPPTFGYMPPPQPNPVIPISAVPPAPPNQASPSSGVSHPHGHSMSASTTQRYNSAQHHQPQPHHQQHQQQQPHTGQNADGVMNTMPGGVPAPHQGQSFYYYYPSPLYFDQAGGAAGPPSLYHTQPFHPQFFAMPNPAYLPNAHAFNQHQQQPPTASQSDAPPPVINQQQPHQQQVNMRTRDIDTKIE